MARRLALGYALIASLWCVQAAAIGLGEITIHSALNQPLNAEIELLEAQGMSESEIVAQLATAEDFKRVGVERFFFLTGLQFHVEMRGGAPLLRVTSAQPITEPYLNFLVQVIWPNGRLLKEYTILLDPPTYKEQAAPAVASPGRSPGGGSAGRVERTPTRPDSEVSLSNTPRSTPPASQSPPSDRLTGDSYGVTDRDDTLWRIAQRVRPAADVSVQQTMLALARLNPKAFIGGNINLLKAGYTLRLPSEADATTLSTADAMSEVAAQNEAWQGYRRGEGLARTQPVDGSAPAESQTLAGQVDATAPAPAKPTVAGPDGELRIVAGDAAEGGNGTGGGDAEGAALASELAATKEEADRITRERDEAVSKLDQVASQAEQSQRQIEVRDQQIAQMQQQLKALQQAAGTAAAAPTPPRPESGGMMSLLTSPLVLGVAGIVVVLIVVAGLMRVRSRRRDADQLDLLGESVAVGGASVRPRGMVAALADDGSESDVDLDEPVVPTEEAHDAPSHEVAQTSDVIGEADIYIAYGRYPQAVSLLLTALEDDPNRSDVRVKLLEVYAETKDEASFETHMTELLARCDDNEILLEARDLETKLREDAPVSIGTAGTAPEQPVELAEDEFQLDLDETDGDTAPPKVSTSVAPAAGDLGGDLGIDFKADDEPAAPRPHASAAAVRAQASGDDVAVATADDEGEFDLEDLEFEPQGRNAPKAQSRPAAKGAPADDAFDFLNEEDAATTKLDLARAYIDMGDEDGAREILGEVLQEGSNEQQQVATELLAKLK